MSSANKKSKAKNSYEYNGCAKLNEGDKHKRLFFYTKRQRDFHKARLKKEITAN